MSEGKPIRLPSAAKKLNVGTQTIIDFLNDKGHSVENKPTTKLSPEMFNLLTQEFQKEIVLKQEAAQITLGSKAKKEIEENQAKIKENASILKTEKQKLSGPKIVGKIDVTPQKKETGNTKKEAPTTSKDTDKPTLKKVKADTASSSVKKIEENTIKPIASKDTKEDVSTLKKPISPKDDTNQIIKAKTEKLSGPKILGRIELPVDTKPDKPEEKKKRKRIITNSRVTANKQKPFSKQKKNTKSKKPIAKEVPQISEKEIEEKIKKTMAKIAGTAGKSSRSKLRKAKREGIAEQNEKEQAEQNEKLLQITEFISVSEIASLMNVSSVEVISACMNLGVMVSINQRLDAEIIELVTAEFGYEVSFMSVEDATENEDEDEDDIDTLEERAPIVTIMGHVDHGKTSLLDYIREANVVKGEAGGITQHIGAYEVLHPKTGKKITFLDTPGHEAFTAMRARGAKLTDVAVIVIAADDQVMPQTKEAISHAQSAGVPMIFALNKIDKDTANPDNIRSQLGEMNLLLESWGGKHQDQEISALNGTGVDDLLEKIILESDVLELKANSHRLAVGAVIEAELDKGRGYVATMLIQKGTLKIGDMLVAGSHYGKVKAMFNDRGQKISTAGPSTPVQILGLNGAPQAGEKIKVYASEQEAKQIANKREQLVREQGIRTKKHITLDEIGRRLALGTFKELNVIIKGDVDGSIEALTDSLQKISTEEVQVNVLHKAVGAITESDVMLASASDAIIIGFQVRPSTKVRNLAENENIEIRLYSVIYNAIEEIKSAMEGLLEPTIEENVVGNIEVREIFNISKVGRIAGCYVTSGKVFRNSKIRVIRDGIVVHTGELESLKRFKDDVKEVSTSMECGLNVKGYKDIQVEDIIEAYEEVEVKRTL